MSASARTWKTNPKITARWKTTKKHGTVCNWSSIQFNYWTDMERGVGQHRVHPGKAEQGEENVQAANLTEFWILNLCFSRIALFYLQDAEEYTFWTCFSRIVFFSAGYRGIYILNVFLRIVLLFDVRYPPPSCPSGRMFLSPEKFY